MNPIRFQLQTVCSCCLDTICKKPSTTLSSSLLNSPVTQLCRRAWHKVFWDTDERARLFAYFINTVVCSINVVFYSPFHQLGVMRPFDELCRWIFFSALVIELGAGGLLSWAYYKRSATLSQVWCVLQVSIMLGILLLTLLALVHLTWFGIALLLVSSVIKLYGLWVIYYFSLEWTTKRKDGTAVEVEYLPRESSVPRVRRGTDQTSINSMPHSPTRPDCEEMNRFEFCGDSLPSSPNTPRFILGNSILELAFSHCPLDDDNRVPQYSEIMNMNDPANIHNRPDNIINSDLMCGGLSAVNTEPDSLE